MAEILLVSKPVVPPWNDSSKNLVRDLASALQGHRAHVLGRPGVGPELGDALTEAVYGSADPAARGFSPALADNLRVLRRLLLGGGVDLWHFFFAPNPRTSAVARASSRLRRMPTVQTVCSVPREDVDLEQVLFADRVVVLSKHTEGRFLHAGIDRARLCRIPPAIAPLAEPSESERSEARDRFGVPLDVSLVVYPGDLEFSRGADRALELLQDLPKELDPWLLLACRPKTPAARKREQELRERVGALGLSERVRFVGETRHIHGLLAAADLVVLPSETLYAKMDLPLVLVEAMALGRAVIVAADTPAAELADGQAALCVALERGALAHCASALLEGTDSRAALGRRAREFVLEHYAPGPMAAAYEEVYTALLGS